MEVQDSWKRDVEIITEVLDMDGYVARDNIGQIRSDAFFLHRYIFE